MERFELIAAREDMVKAGFQVQLVADAVASRVNENRDIAINY